MAFTTFSRLAAKRIGAVVRRAERALRASDYAHRDGGRQPSFLQEQAFELSTALEASGTATAYPRDWDPTQGSGDGAYVTDTSTTFTVRDTQEIGHRGVIGAKGFCHIRFKTDGTKFGEIVRIQQDVITVMTNFQVDAANQKLQKKTRDVVVSPAAAETGWTDVHTGSVCP